MINCTNNDGSYTIEGLNIEDLKLIQEGLHKLFNESQKKEHREFRTQVLRIDRAIDPQIEEYLFMNDFNNR